MKEPNKWSKVNRFAITCAALIIFLTATAANSYAQSGTRKSKNPCVNLTFTGEHNNPTYAWKNQDNGLCKQAVASLRAASVIILGFDTQSDVFGERRLQEWLVDIGDSAAWTAKFNDGFDFKNATDWLKETRSWVDYQYNKIPLEIYGRSITAAEQAAFRAAVESKKSWYAPLFLAEKQKLNNNPAEREAMINRAYQKVFNRNANNREMAKWKPGKEIYRELVAQIKK